MYPPPHAAACPPPYSTHQHSPMQILRGRGELQKSLLRRRPSRCFSADRVSVLPSRRRTSYPPVTDPGARAPRPSQVNRGHHRIEGSRDVHYPTNRVLQLSCSGHKCACGVCACVESTGSSGWGLGMSAWGHSGVREGDTARGSEAPFMCSCAAHGYLV